MSVRDFLGARVDLFVVVAMDFLLEDLLGRFDIGDHFSDTVLDESILELQNEGSIPNFVMENNKAHLYTVIANNL